MPKHKIIKLQNHIQTLQIVYIGIYTIYKILQCCYMCNIDNCFILFLVNCKVLLSLHP